MNYIPHTDRERAEMLATIGVESMEHLFDAIPSAIRFPKLALPPALSEMEIMRELMQLSDANADVLHSPCFLGAGAYHHYIPSIVDSIVRRGEFLTAYTPYQPEVSQGTLQAIFEFQSMIRDLTGMEICTASHYDGATSFAEAVLMSLAITHRARIVVSTGIHPQYRQVLQTYTEFNDTLVISEDDNVTDLAALADCIDEETACVCVSNPSFFGDVVDLSALAARAHAMGALLIVVTNPIALALFAPPSTHDADIVVGEGQPLGVPLSYGGPYLGFFCTKREYMRRIPGRIVGETVDRDGTRGFVLTLKTREQDIRREKATSNICTNQGLMALCACVYMSAMGKNGLQKVANLSYQKSHYTSGLLSAIPGFAVKNTGPFFHEFVLECPRPISEINQALLDDHHLIGGYDLGQEYAHLKNHMLVCVTETQTRATIEQFATALADICS